MRVRARRTAALLRRHFDLLTALLPSLLVLVVLSVVGLAIRYAQTVTNSKQHTQIVQSCERLNVKQIEDNRSQYADYRFFELQLDQRRAVAGHGTLAQRQATQAFLNVGRVAADAKSWVPPIADCGRVSVRYRLPVAVPFYRRLPPPAALANH